MPAPRYFGPDARPLFGWRHGPHTGRLGVVVANPFGYEAICAHRSLRHLAERLADAGLAVLRFDYDGTGDSAGGDEEPERVAAWLASLHEGIEELKRSSGVEHVALVGLRLGALLASHVAAERDDVATLVAMAPVVSGRRYLRELMVLQGALGLGGPPEGLAPAAVHQEALGFAVAKETKEALSLLALKRIDPARLPRVVVLDRDDLPSAEGWTTDLAAAGVDVTREVLPGYVEMMLDPHHSVVPEAMIDAVVRHLANAGGATPPSNASPTPELEPRGHLGGVDERALALDHDLFGIVSALPEGCTSGRAIVLLNAGAVHRVGPNRLYTCFARRWALRGDMVLRCDLSGLGDSPTRTGEPENVVYGARALDDLAIALRWLGERSGVKRVYAVGLCSGAYHALEGAVAGLPMHGLVSVNPLTFDYDPDEPLDASPHKVTGEARRYAAAMRDPGKWRKLLRGEVDLHAVRQTVARRVRGLAAARLRDYRRRLGFPEPGDLGAKLEGCAARGVGVRFIFGSDDPGRRLLIDGAGASLPGLLEQGAVTVQIIDGADHTFTARWSHKPLSRALDRALDELDESAR